MKAKIWFFSLFVLPLALISCSEDEKEVRKGDPDITHESAHSQWNIVSADYTLIDQNTSGTVGQTFKTGTKENAGTFYFSDDLTSGSFEMNIEGYNKEDVFNSNSDSDSGSISIFSIEQNVGVQTNQNILSINGDATATEMTLEGTIVKQSTTGQFMLTVSLSLVKK
jgi:hypothetical protein